MLLSIILNYIPTWNYHKPSPNYAKRQKNYNKWYTFNQKDKYNIKECGICLQKFTKDPPNKLLSTLYCGHTFHFDCIASNEHHNQTSRNNILCNCKCPMCRQKYYIWIHKYTYQNYSDDNQPHYLRNMFMSYYPEPIQLSYWISYHSFIRYVYKLYGVRIAKT